MVTIKNLIDLVTVFGSHAQEALDFISDEANQQKLQRYLGFTADPDVVVNSLVQRDRADMKTKIRIALDNGMFLTKEEWKDGQYSNDNVLGIAISTPCVQFILGLHQWKERWSEDTDHCITERHNESEALQVISGYEHTKAIAEAQSEEGNTAAKLCWNYGFKGRQWYLPSILELCAVCANKDEINELLKLVGGDLLDLDECYWSSTEYSAYGSWGMYFNDGLVGTGLHGKYYTYVVRPAVAY